VVHLWLSHYYCFAASYVVTAHGSKPGVTLARSGSVPALLGAASSCITTSTILARFVVEASVCVAGSSCCRLAGEASAVRGG
jgi:hypothetical protein